MEIVGLTLVLLVLLFGILAVLARSFQRHSVADLLDWKPTRSPETEAQLEVADVEQMIAAQNEYRRRRGARELTEEDAERLAAEDQRVRARGRGPFADPASRADAPPAGDGGEAGDGDRGPDER